MPQSITCNFRKGHLHGEKYTKDFVVFKYPEDKELPEFPLHIIFHHTLQFAAYKLSKGLWIETVDGYICPIIQSTYYCFRIPGGGRYIKASINAGNKVYFDAPHGEKLIFDKYREGTNKGFHIKNYKMLRFCWAMAQVWDIKRASRIAGYNEKTGMVIFDLPKIRRCIVSALALHMKAAAIGEEYVVEKKSKLIEELGELNKLVQEDIKGMLAKGNVDKDELDAKLSSFLKLAERVGSEINDFAGWIGYSNKISGKMPDNVNVFQFGDNNGDGNKLEGGKGNVGLLPTKNSFEDAPGEEVPASQIEHVVIESNKMKGKDDVNIDISDDVITDLEEDCAGEN